MLDVLSDNIQDSENIKDQVLMSSEPFSINLLVLELKKEVEDTRYTPNSLALKSGLDPKTIRKILNLSYKRPPGIDVVQRLLSVLSGKQTITSISSFYGGEIEKYLEFTLPQYFSNTLNAGQIDNSIANQIKEFVDYHIIRICDQEKGVSFDKLVNTISILMLKKDNLSKGQSFDLEESIIYKKIAESKIQRLIKVKSLIKTKDDKLRTSVLNIEIPLELTMKYFGDTILFCEPSQWNINDFFTRIKFGSCSEEESRLSCIALFNGFKSAYDIVENSNHNEVSLQVIASIETMEFTK